MTALKRHLLSAAAGVLTAAIVAVTLSALAPAAPSPSGVDEGTGTYGYLKLFNEVLALIRNGYVEQVPEVDLMKGAYDGLLASLDGESEYLTGAEYAALRAKRPGADAETGLFLTRRDGVLFVAAVIPGSSAEEKALRLGDQIRRIGDRNGRDLSLFEAEEALRGPAGSRASVSVIRRDEPKREDVEIERRRLAIPAPSLEPARDGVAVVRMPGFGPGAARTLGGLLDRLEKDRVTRVVIDLRGNAWGAIDEAIQAASLLEGDGVIARLKGRAGEEKTLRGTGRRSSWRGETLLLTDAGTARAAEIFVAALVDAGVARQAGETTLGRGGEREFIPLANGDWLALTVRKYVTPSGKGWHGTGLTPSVPMPADPQTAFKERADEQLRKAVEYLRDLAAAAKAA